MNEILSIIDRCPHCEARIETTINDASIEKFGSMEAARTIAILRKCNCKEAREELRTNFHRNFRGFVSGDLVNLMIEEGLDEISIKSGRNAAKLKRDKDGNIQMNTTIGETL